MEKKTQPFTVNRRAFLTTTGGLLAGAAADGRSASSGAVEAQPEPEALWPEPIRQKRAAWWRDEGVVVAGDNWESLLPRLRAGSFDESQASMSYDEKMAVWRREHSEEMARRLKEMGFNFIMIPLYKGGGLKAERTSLEDAKRFTEICHRLGLRVGCYTTSGTILYEAMLAEHPEAKDWFAMDQNGRYVTYGPLYFRRYANRSHPGFRKFILELVRYAVREVKVDLLHFDNNTAMNLIRSSSSGNIFETSIRRKSGPADSGLRKWSASSLRLLRPSPMRTMETCSIATLSIIDVK